MSNVLDHSYRMLWSYAQGEFTGTYPYWIVIWEQMKPKEHMQEQGKQEVSPEGSVGFSKPLASCLKATPGASSHQQLPPN